MPNPAVPSPLTSITSAWGAAVVSRVVGIYTDLASAEADGRTEAGALVTLTDASVWVKRSTTSGDWQRVHTLFDAELIAGVAGIATSPTWTSLGVVTVTIDANAATTVVPYRVKADAVIGLQNNDSGGIVVETQIRVSANLGASWNNGPIIPARVVGGAQDSVVAKHHRIDINPTGGPPIDFRSELRVRAVGSSLIDVLGGTHDLTVMPSLP